MGSKLIFPLIAALILTCRVYGQIGPSVETRVFVAIARDAGVEVQSGWKLSFLAPWLRVPAQSSVHLRRVGLAGQDAVFLRFECGSRQECLPFQALLQGAGVEASFSNALVGQSGRHGHVVNSPAMGNRGTQPAVRAGQHLRMTEELSGMRLSVPVISLQTGSVGQKIRVRNAATHKVVVARVLEEGHVRVGD